MPTQEIFQDEPPFPDDLAVYNLPKLSYAKLLSGDSLESHRLFRACSQLGFFQLHLRDDESGEDFIRAAEGILDLNVEISALPVYDKSKFVTKPPFILGWKAPGKTRLEDGREDRCEFYSISQDSALGTNRTQSHPGIVSNSKSVLESFTTRAHDVSLLVLFHLNKQLKLPKGTLASLHSISKPSMTTIRLIHMPPQPAEDRRASLFGHTDDGSITVLFNVIGGLQILAPGLANEDRNWAWIRPEAGCAIVNLGDALVQWSGGILKSCFHRVVSPPALQADCNRYSFAYVLKPNNEALMRALTAPFDKRNWTEDDRYLYKEWLAIKGAASQTGKNLVRIESRDRTRLKADFNVDMMT